MVQLEVAMVTTVVMVAIAASIHGVMTAARIPIVVMTAHHKSILRRHSQK